MDKSKEDRINEIDEKIYDLSLHTTMWSRAGGVGGSMALRALGEIEALREEREDIVNDTENVGIEKIYARLRELKILRAEANILKKVIYDAEIAKREKEIKDFRESHSK